MSKTTKNPIALARTALEAGKEALPPYSHPKSPHKFTPACQLSAGRPAKFLCTKADTTRPIRGAVWGGIGGIWGRFGGQIGPDAGAKGV